MIKKGGEKMEQQDIKKGVGAEEVGKRIGIKNLRPPKTKEEARERGRRGGIKSGKVRAEMKTAREIVELLDSLPVENGHRIILSALGIPETMFVQKTLRYVALHKKSLTGDAVVNKLLLEIEGEKPSDKLDVKVESYENVLKNLNGKQEF
jgi:hypothetical protein